ncbi:BlaI/MecI/CopY family transcriptional regulator [Stieleria varia]|uniref:Penicillinase repressor n=1 Tax=Stieleria varia TaxID=2528005 RepID=A0A5C6AQ04_9BACT|nr:BlaI/MecI/CopY family transcriptional regulator [Stieleria varia]TWU01156.1 Penicillinase repressor [Stieleria varia]
MRFTPGELRVMKLLWEHGELSPPELQEFYGAPIKDPALRSYLTILVEKGHVTRRRDGKAFRYKATTPKRRAFHEMVRELADAFCDGSLRSLMMNLAEQESLTEQDLAELRDAAGLGSQESMPSDSKSKGSKRTARNIKTKKKG